MGITTAARRPPPAYRAQAAPPHIRVDLMARESTTNAFSSLDNVTDLVFAAYVEKPTMAETVGPNARMLKNTLDALAARNVPLQRILLAGGAKSYGFSLGAFNAPAKETEPRLIAPIHYHPRRSARMTHLCSVRVTHTKNTICPRAREEGQRYHPRPRRALCLS